MSENKNQAGKPSKSILKSGLVLSVMTLASRIMGLVREMTRASFLGTSMYSDAFTTSFMIPNLLRRLFAENSISVAFIPTFKDYLEKTNDENKSDEQKLSARRETLEFLKATFTLISFMTACIVVLGIIVTPFIAQIFCKKPVDASAADFALQMDAWLLKKQEVTILTRIMFPYLFVISIAAFFQGILNGCKIFAPSGFTPVLFNGIVILGTYVLSPFTENPARAMSIGVITGGCIQALFQLPFVLKTGWKVGITSLKKTFSNPGTKRVIALIGPTVLGMAAYQINDLISTALASRAEVGVVSSLQFSLRLQELILGIFAVSIGTVILPDLSGLASKKEWDKFNAMLLQAIKIITLITIPVTFYSLICGNELITLLYRNKRFDEHSVMLTTGEFRYHIAGLFFIAVNRIISPAFYAQGNTKLPTLAGIISMVCNMIFAVVLVMPMSGNGIALALSLASAVNTVFLFIFLGKMQSINIKKVTFDTIFYIFRITVFSVIAAIPCKLLRPVLLESFKNYPRLISQGVPIAALAVIFGLIGIALLVITKDEMALALKNKIKR